MRVQVEPDFETAREIYGEIAELSADEITQILWGKRGEK
jgi:hypothetical protein